jgi:hypothetical protein
MSSEDNLIRFPGSKKGSKDKNKSYSEENAGVSSVKENVISFSVSREKNTRSVDESKKDSIQQEGRRDNVIFSVPSEGLVKKNQKSHHYAFAAVACSLCLMLVSFPFLNQYKPESLPSRGLACSPEDKQCRMTEVQKWSKHLQKEKEALHLIHTGQRKLASIGRKPRVKDVFFIELLRSRYDVRWHKGKLVYAVLLKDQEPVPMPDTGKVVNQYSSLFPAHSSIRKLDSISGDLEVYELKDSEGLNTAQVEALKDVEGGLLSIHVEW